MERTFGLNGPPPPAIVMLAFAIGLHTGCGLGDGLGPGEGLGLGDGVTPAGPALVFRALLPRD